MNMAHILIDPEVSNNDEQIYYQHCGHFPHDYAEYFLAAALENEPGVLVEMLDNLKHVPANLRRATINYSRMTTYSHSFANGKEIKYGHAGETPLIGAGRKGNFTIVKLLLQAGADVTLKTVIGGEEFDAEGVVKRELMRTRLAISSIWNGSYIPGDDLVNDRVTPYIKMVMRYQCSYEAILMMMAPTRYVWNQSVYSCSLMGHERFRGFRDTPNIPISTMDLDLLYRGFIRTTVTNNPYNRYTVDRYIQTMKEECQRQEKVFRL